MFKYLASIDTSGEIQSLLAKLSMNQNICKVIKENYKDINLTNCELIYSGVFNKSLYQVVTVFLHDTLQGHITFISKQKEDQKYLNATLGDLNYIDLIDAV